VICSVKQVYNLLLLPASVFYCFLSVLYPLSFPPKLLAACHHDVIRALASYVSSAVLFLTWIFLHQFFSKHLHLCFFSVQLVLSILLHTKLSKAFNFFLSRFLAKVVLEWKCKTYAVVVSSSIEAGEGLAIQGSAWSRMMLVGRAIIGELQNRVSI